MSPKRPCEGEQVCSTSSSCKTQLDPLSWRPFCYNKEIKKGSKLSIKIFGLSSFFHFPHLINTYINNIIINGPQIKLIARFFVIIVEMLISLRKLNYWPDRLLHVALRTCMYRNL